MVGTCVLALAWIPHLAGASAPSSAPGSTTAVTAATSTQAQSGVAAATENYLVFTGQEEEFGRYVTGGQLGSGRYQWTATYDDTNCTDSGGEITVSGQASFTRFDGAVLSGTVTGTEGCLFEGPEPVSLTVNLTAGARDLVGAHVVLEGIRAFGRLDRSGETDSTLLKLTGSATVTAPIGYWIVGQSGSVSAFGGLDAHGNAVTSRAVTHLEPTPDHAGYWIVDTDGHVFPFGDASWLGDAPSSALAAGETVTNLSATPSGQGYWLFTSRGRALSFGDATFRGDLRAVNLNGPVIGAVATPTGHGYYMVASDGGVFAFGDAVFRGSMGAVRLNRPVNGLVPAAGNTGYWLVASDGGVFAFDAPFLGSMGGRPLNQPVVGLARYGNGYLMVGSDGGLFNFSNGLFWGSLGGVPQAHPIVGVAATG
jgi:hypothetical protein